MNSTTMKVRSFLLPLFVIFTGLSLSVGVQAETTVCAAGCDYTTIQAALNNASNNDTIKVMDAVHTEPSILFDQFLAIDNITIEGQGRDQTIVQAMASVPTPGVDSPWVFGVTGGKNLTLRNMHVRHGGFIQQGGAVFCFSGKIDLEGVRVADSTSRFGAGIFIGFGCHESSLDDVIVEDNIAIGPGRGGGLYLIESHEVSITDSHFRNNFAEDAGGGLRVADSVLLEVSNSTFTDNEAFRGGGVGMVLRSNARFHDSTISGNEAVYGGGVDVVDFQFSNETIFRSFGVTISGNTAQIAGGGLNIDSFFAAQPRSVLSNSTISGNRAFDFGSALAITAQLSGNTQVVSYNSTIANNTTGFNQPDKHAVTIRVEEDGEADFIYANSIISNPDPGTENCGIYLVDNFSTGALRDVGSNVASDFSCNIFNVGSLVADPRLGPLADNGGPTQTHAFLFADSLAVDRHNDPDCGQPAPFPGDVDQRGTSRPQAAGCDSGAYELTPIDAINSQIVFVEGLTDAGTFSKSWGKSLSSKLRKALEKIETGNTDAARTKLEDFIVQMENLVADGKISEENSASTLATIQWALDHL